MDLKTKFVFCLTLAFSSASSLTKELERTEGNGTLECPAYGYDCFLNDIEQGAISTNWKDCAYQCANHKTCVYWSWVVTTSGINPGVCFLKSMCPLPLANPLFISGHFDCPFSKED
ncbi:uncharacterized protein LOC111708926 [Eurytemora carolleeae]|uniref:uncharacterized protein LOC111708926 n=1 Tax=Eurytemora carolleeae TaxID=1294199 RepID=UPI000C7752F2|nr:uncharacterized protein LOC111708926 [Eurytemora carolleeae]|eukprot:XP_023338202.1 uncharacterized protein LOC111708926 [Eurytemora affinis]